MLRRGASYWIRSLQCLGQPSGHASPTMNLSASEATELLAVGETRPESGRCGRSRAASSWLVEQETRSAQPRMRECPESRNRLARASVVLRLARPQAPYISLCLPFTESIATTSFENCAG